MREPRLAYTAIVEPHGYSVVLAQEDRPGYSPIPNMNTFPTYAAAKQAAADLNADRLGLSVKDALVIVLSSMRGDGVARKS